MRHYKAILPVLSFFLITACATSRPDPLKEEVEILQKQLLELQKVQNETKARLDESTATINRLASKLQTLEERERVRAVSRSQISSEQTSTSPDKKKPPTKKKIKTKKKTKKARRQE